MGTAPCPKPIGLKASSRRQTHGFLAGKAFAGYRARGGKETAPLPDFYIGARAAVSGKTLITRDVKRYRTYFPTVELNSP